MLMPGFRRRWERSSRAAFTLVIRVALGARIDESHRSAGGATADRESAGAQVLWPACELCRGCRGYCSCFRLDTHEGVRTLLRTPSTSEIPLSLAFVICIFPT